MPMEFRSNTNTRVSVTPIDPLPVAIYGGGSTSAVISTPADAQANVANGQLGYVRGYVFNGTTWDRQYGNTAGTYVNGSVASGGTDAGNPIKIGGVFTTTPASVATGQRRALEMTSNGSIRTVIGPSTDASAGLTPTVALGVSGLLLKASAGNVFSAKMTAGATAGFFVLYNATALPGAGAALTAALILDCVAVPANGTVELAGKSVPVRCGTGAVLLFTTTLATYTAPANLATHMAGSFI